MTVRLYPQHKQHFFVNRFKLMNNLPLPYSIWWLVIPYRTFFLVASHEYLRKPSTPEEWIKISEGFFHQLWNFPHCLGLSMKSTLWCRRQPTLVPTSTIIREHLALFYWLFMMLNTASPFLILEILEDKMMEELWLILPSVSHWRVPLCLLPCPEPFPVQYHIILLVTQHFHLRPTCCIHSLEGFHQKTNKYLIIVCPGLAKWLKTLSESWQQNLEFLEDILLLIQTK